MRKLAALTIIWAVPAMAQVPSAAPAPKGVVTGSFQFPNRPVWAGEVFRLKFAWHVDWDQYRYLESDLAWTSDPLVTEGWTRDPQEEPRTTGGKRVANVSYTTRAMSMQPGPIKLKPAQQQMQIVTGSYVTSGMTIATIGPVSAKSAGATLTVRPLPAAPSGFTGAVGAFTLRSTLDKPRGEVGKPIIWTLTLSGTGNWAGFDGVPSRPLSRDFDVVGAPKQREEKGEETASLFERSVAEQITIVPRKAGRFSLGPVEMIVFDPQAGRYRTITAPALSIEILPGTAGNQPLAYEAEPDATPAGEPMPPVLRGAELAWAPLPRWAWRSVLTLPPVAIGLLWLALAIIRARVADPDRAARRAHARLATTIAALAAGPTEAARRHLVRSWQRDVGIRLKFDHAAPLAGMFGQADWAQLWDEADGYLYGRDMHLPADWQARAASALAAQGEPPRFDVRNIFAVRNLYPVTAILCALLMAGTTPLAAFDQPRPVQRQAMAPGDWISHYNLGRTAAEARRWDLAAAHAGIAWVQHPHSAETRQLWSMAAREAGFAGREGGGLPLPDGWAGKLTGLLSPLGWQMIAIVAMLLALGGFGTLLLRRFGYVPRHTRRWAMIGAGLGALGLVAGIAGVHGYGPAAAADAAIVWRSVPLRALPIDTPEDEAVTTLAPGTAGHMEQAFMGWVRITLTDGRTGWLRHDELLPLWRRQP